MTHKCGVSTVLHACLTLPRMEFEILHVSVYSLEYASTSLTHAFTHSFVHLPQNCAQKDLLPRSVHTSMLCGAALLYRPCCCDDTPLQSPPQHWCFCGLCRGVLRWALQRDVASEVVIYTAAVICAGDTREWSMFWITSWSARG